MLACLPLLSYLALVRFGWRRREGPDPRPAVLTAAVVWGTLAATLTEVLSLFGGLTAVGLAVGWLAVTLVTLALDLRVKALPVRRAPDAAWHAPLTRGLLLAAGGVAAVSGLVAALSWPNEWDSMVYHLSRVEHWIQDRSVAFYPTHVTHQLYNPPWAEYAILQFAALGGEDRLANLVQWVSLVGCALAASSVAARLGAAPHGQALAALFSATVPMGILQASSTQNDYVIAFWLICLVDALLALRAARTPGRTALLAGAALGLALLTKGTAYVTAAPVVALLLLPRPLSRLAAWRTGRVLVAEGLRTAGTMVLMALALNAPQFIRNVDLSGSPLGPVYQRTTGESDATFGFTNEAYSVQILASNVIRNLALHLGTPFPAVNRAEEAAVRIVHRWLGLDPSDPRTTWRRTEFEISEPLPQDCCAGSPLHLGLATVALAGVGFGWRRASLGARHAVGVVAAAALFCLLLKWQPWNSRHHLALFVLLAPLVGLVLARWTRVTAVVGVALALLALPYLLRNDSRPLVGPDSVLVADRVDQLFRVWPRNQPVYVGAAEALRAGGCWQVGLLVEQMDWEYPLWALLPELRRQGRLEHVGVTSISGKLAGRWPPFEPCALVVTRRSAEARLVLNGRTYRRVWSSTRSTDTSVELKVYLQDR